MPHKQKTLLDEKETSTAVTFTVKIEALKNEKICYVVLPVSSPQTPFLALSDEYPRKSPQEMSTLLRGKK